MLGPTTKVQLLTEVQSITFGNFFDLALFNSHADSQLLLKGILWCYHVEITVLIYSLFQNTNVWDMLMVCN